jgi:hypothetical protein
VRFQSLPRYFGGFACSMQLPRLCKRCLECRLSVCLCYVFKDVHLACLRIVIVALTSRSRVLQKLIVAQQLKFPTFYGTRRFTTATTGSCPHPCESYLHPTILFSFEVQFNIALPSTPKSSQRRFSDTHEIDQELINIFRDYLFFL